MDAPHEATHYRARVDAWNDVLEVHRAMPAWRGWHKSFVFVDEFVSWAEASRERSVSRYAFGIKARELMKTHRTVFASEQLAGLDDPRGAADLAEYVERSMHELAARMEADV